MTLRVYVDFNTMATDDEERVFINTVVYPELADQLRPGLPIVLADETLEVKAVAEFDSDHQRWFGRPDWSTSRDLPSPLAAEAVHGGQ
jgi:hypothetical protein